MGKDNEPVVPKKVRENIKKEVFESIDEVVVKDLASKVMNEVENSMNSEYKENLKERITNELVEDIKEDIRKEEKKLSRKKSFKIFRLYIYILLLIAAASYLIYLLYINGDLKVLDKVISTTKKADIETTEVVTTTELVKDNEWYLKEYGDILDNVKISDTSLLKNKTVISELPMSSKLALAYNILSEDSILIDESIITINEANLNEAFVTLFGVDAEYINTSFNVGNVNFVYSKNSSSYMAIQENIEIEKVVNVIDTINEVDGKIIVKAYAGYIKNDNLYSINYNRHIRNYNYDSDLKDFTKYLNQVTYTFVNVDGTYYLEQIN